MNPFNPIRLVLNRESCFSIDGRFFILLHFLGGQRNRYEKENRGQISLDKANSEEFTETIKESWGFLRSYLSTTDLRVWVNRTA